MKKNRNLVPIKRQNSMIHNLDPFLNLWETKFRLPEGITDHPHRGMISITYCISGTLFYEDSNGK